MCDQPREAASVASHISDVHLDCFEMGARASPLGRGDSDIQMLVLPGCWQCSKARDPEVLVKCQGFVDFPPLHHRETDGIYKAEVLIVELSKDAFGPFLDHCI